MLDQHVFIQKPKAISTWALNQLDTSQRFALENIRVEQDLIFLSKNWEWEWYGIFNEQLATCLPGLRTAHISICVRQNQPPRMEEARFKLFLCCESSH